MDAQNLTQRAPQKDNSVMDHSEELLAEVDEPPDELKPESFWSSPKYHDTYRKAPPQFARRESLLTRQLHSETEHTDDDLASPLRTLSTQSTWSNPSTTSTADLTSDDGHSVPSPAMSPPLPPVNFGNTLPVPQKALDSKVKIVGQEDGVRTSEKESKPEQTVEANLGRKRMISFACRSKQDSTPTPTPAPASETEQAPTSPPKRKCMLKFVCPSRAEAESKPAQKTTAKRASSPPPISERSSSTNTKHRGSDSTVTHVSPHSIRKTTPPKPQAPTSNPTSPVQKRRYSNASDESSGAEATRFHEFGTSEEEPEAWVQESTCYRTRLTVEDTLRKESTILKICQEAEEEVLEEEEDEEEEEEIEEEDAAAGEDEAEEDESDEGFHSDDEDGFANSDSENDSDSDFEWWKPSGRSTAATSVDHLDRLAIVHANQAIPSSSIGSHSSGHLSPRTSRLSLRKSNSKRHQTSAININKPGPTDLPDSTDFVCGTLDEDRPIEQAYINRQKAKEAAKHGTRPQDIDPTFPTSDPEMDEEDDDDVDEVGPSDDDRDDLMHGSIDGIHGGAIVKRASSPLRRIRSSGPRSPPPPTRHHSPPPSKKKSMCRSPPPPPRRSVARSPPPSRTLFGRSPARQGSPATVRKMTSPPNSPTERSAQHATAPHGLGGRPALTHTASLPKNGPITLSKLTTISSDDEISDAETSTIVPKRGAIDIVKGLEKKRNIRKQKLYQKLCAKAAAKGEKPIKIKPGKGCERMREVGLQLQQYHGKAEHILSL